MSISTVFPNTFKLLLIALLSLGFSTLASAQIPAGGANGGRPGFNPAQMNIGRFYGKVVDDNTGKGIGYASVQLIGMRFDSTSRSMKPAVIAGQLTEENGDFSLENLPIMGEFTLKVVIIGYDAVEKKVSFGVKMGPGVRPDPSMVDKDLGNIRISTSSEMLKEVTVDAEASGVGLALDKKIFKVDRNNLAAGGTAEDALRTVPSLTVDIDGNLTLRNAAPQLFVDGRPTALSLDQIPADAIDNVEIITNPSAKYDASGGNAGIVNIVLKKNRRVGYNGSVRAGLDMRGRGNLGGDINARDRKINAFLSGSANMRRSITNGETDRINLFGSPRTEVFQENRSTTDRYFLNGRAGFDWFVNNRNTITLAGNYTQGQFDPTDRQNIHTDTILQNVIGASDAVRTSETSRGFRNLGGQLLYKHLFPRDGMEWTADINYNGSRNEGEGTFITDYANDQLDGRQQQDSKGGNDFVTAQTDYVMPLKNGLKVEAGARAAIRNFRTENANFQYDYLLNEYVQVVNFADRYRYNDQVYALYGTFSQSFKKWGYQVGLRVESSQYTGELPANGQVFENDYPFTPFPSVFLTYKVNEEDNVQLNYSRRINRPGFFQLIPFPDFSDSLLLSRGNPDLLPEFTNSLEFSYQNIFNKQHNVLFTAYFKQATDLITRYQFTEYNEFLGRDAVVSSFANANSSIAYGAEITFKNTLWKSLEITSNLNAYNSIVDAGNVEANLRNEQFTWFIKENISYKLPKQFTLQVNGEYQSRTAFAASTGGGGRWGGGGGHGGWGGTSNTAQGYTRPVWFVDLSLRKDLWQRKASVTLAFEDVFRSRRNGSFTGSSFFTQDTWRLRDPQFVRLNFSYRFGKFDVSLFKRKNTKVSTEGMEGMF